MVDQFHESGCTCSGCIANFAIFQMDWIDSATAHEYHARLMRWIRGLGEHPGLLGEFELTADMAKEDK